MARLRTSRRGAALVELALVLPMLLLLTLGVIEYGWMFLKAQQVNDAARQGARFGATSSVTTVTQVLDPTSPAMQALTNAGIPVHTGTVSVPTGVTPGTGKSVTVVVSVPYSDVSLTGFSVLPVPDTLKSSVTMLKEGP